MTAQFFQRPILNSPYEIPAQHWKLDPHGLPTDEIIPSRREVEFLSPVPAPKTQAGEATQLQLAGDFASMILEELRTAGVQQADRKDRIEFTSLEPWPGEEHIAAVGRYQAGSGPDGRQRRAGIVIGPEFGTISRADLVGAAREAAPPRFSLPWFSRSSLSHARPDLSEPL